MGYLQIIGISIYLFIERLKKVLQNLCCNVWQLTIVTSKGIFRGFCEIINDDLNVADKTFIFTWIFASNQGLIYW